MKSIAHSYLIKIVNNPNAARSADATISAILVANRSEIAIRVIRAAAEVGISTVAIFAKEHRLALHRFNAGESYLGGKGKVRAKHIWISTKLFGSLSRSVGTGF